MRIRIRIGAVLLAVTFLATFLTILLGCLPVSKHWQIYPDPGSTCLNAGWRIWADLRRFLSTRDFEAPSSRIDHVEHLH